MKQKSSNPTEKTGLKGKLKWAAGLVVVTFLSFGGLLATQQNSIAADIVVYKNPNCGCCNAWIKHLKENDYTVEVKNRDDVTPIKKELGVPNNLQSCHTAKVDGYVIEGHVPADLISKLRREKPQIRGLAVPGMPMGSPGMEGPYKDDYNIISFSDDGKTSVYAHR
ncbi:MAG: DUF411 domain-containing protein [Candidatus Sedimenticola sp. (ex Thyasira tokunagai)]